MNIELGNYSLGLIFIYDQKGNMKWKMQEEFLPEDKMADIEKTFDTLEEAQKYFHPIWYENAQRLKKHTEEQEEKARKKDILNTLIEEEEENQIRKEAQEEREKLRREAEKTVSDKVAKKKNQKTKEV